jgi:hypothetical protein
MWLKLTAKSKGCNLVPIHSTEVATSSPDIPLLIPTPSETAFITHGSPLAVPSNTHISTHGLNTAAKISIGIGVTISIFLIAFLIYGIPYVRNRRCERALQRAVDEVERGIEMHKDVSHGSVSQSKENMVLESRVEIVVGDYESERGVVDTWDGWDASWEDEDDELERGRKGMSLPRREY